MVTNNPLNGLETHSTRDKAYWKPGEQPSDNEVMNLGEPMTTTILNLANP